MIWHFEMQGFVLALITLVGGFESCVRTLRVVKWLEEKIIMCILFLEIASRNSKNTGLWEISFVRCQKEIVKCSRGAGLSTNYYYSVCISTLGFKKHFRPCLLRLIIKENDIAIKRYPMGFSYRPAQSKTRYPSVLAIVDQEVKS